MLRTDVYLSLFVVSGKPAHVHQYCNGGKEFNSLLVNQLTVEDWTKLKSNKSRNLDYITLHCLYLKHVKMRKRKLAYYYT